MSSESDSEVFFDAEDTTPVRTIKIKDINLKSDDKLVDKPSCESSDTSPQMVVSAKDDEIKFPVIKVSNDDLKEAERKAKENEKRRRKVEEQRNRMLMDDDEILQVPSEQSSLASSVDGIFPSVNSNMNNIILGQSSEESKSTISLGKVGSILGEKASISSDVYAHSKEVDTVSTDSKYSVSESGMICDINSTNFSKTAMKGPEPDLVASTKGERTELVCPVVPPRKKRRNKSHARNTHTQAAALTPSDVVPESFGNVNTDVYIPPSPDPIESLSKEIEHSLDLQSATRGQYVVKPEDREQDRAEGPRNLTLSEKKDCGANGDSHSSAQPSPISIRKGSLKKDIQDGQYFVRTKTDSGRTLTDQEILASVKVLNLDTGEQIPLSLAEERLPRCLNPLSLHIMRLTSEYVSNTALDKERESDEESTGSRKTDIDRNSVWNKTREITRVFSRNIENSVNKLKTAGKAVADKVHHTRHNEDISEDELPADSRSSIEIKMSSKLKSVDKGRKEGSEFERIRVVQELSGEHTGAIWTMKFSSCGRLLATAGQDHFLRIWILKDSFKYFDDMRQKFSAAEGKTSPTPSEENSSPTGTLEPTFKSPVVEKGDEDVNQISDGPFINQPFCRYKAHTAEILDVSWSKNYFILSSSMDKTVRLWHISRPECLCCFQHIDFVTAIAFHPRDDSYFLSGSLDGKLRLWNIPDKKVTLWNELDGQTKLITAVNFCRNGKIAVVGSYDGRCIFYNTDQLKYYTQIHVRSSRGKNKGRKISGIEAMPGEDKLLVTSNDSRIRLYDLRDLSLSCKYKGYVNLSSQIKATFSHDGKYIMSGSENQFIYIWKTFHDYAKFSRRDRNDYWERIKAHNAVVTSAIFAPNPSLILKQLESEQDDGSSSSVRNMEFSNCYVMVSADFSGTIKVFLHKSRNGMPS